MKLSLYTIEAEYLQIAEELQNNGGELTEELELALTINKDQLQVKSAGYAFVIKETESEILTIDNEIDRLNKMKSVRNNAIERLKNAVKSAMELYGVEKIESNTIKIILAKSPASVVIDDESKIPAKYKKKEVKISLLKKEIGNDLKAGLKVKGASLETEKKNLRIS
jgi:archaellum component FlaG (FlaF/FlaG flagellin family)